MQRVDSLLTSLFGLELQEQLLLKYFPYTHTHEHKHTHKMFLHGHNCSDLSLTRPQKFSTHTVMRKRKIMKQCENVLHDQLPLAEACGLFELHYLFALYFHALFWMYVSVVLWYAALTKVLAAGLEKQWFALWHFTAVWIQMTNIGAEINIIKHTVIFRCTQEDQSINFI